MRALVYALVHRASHLYRCGGLLGALGGTRVEVDFARQPAKVHLTTLDASGEVFQVGLRAFYQRIGGIKINRFHLLQLPAQLCHDGLQTGDLGMERLVGGMLARGGELPGHALCILAGGGQLGV